MEITKEKEVANMQRPCPVIWDLAPIQADTDEYMAPMGNFKNLQVLLSRLEKQGINVLNWKSKRSKPRLQYVKWVNVNIVSIFNVILYSFWHDGVEDSVLTQEPIRIRWRLLCCRSSWSTDSKLRVRPLSTNQFCLKHRAITSMDYIVVQSASAMLP